MNVQRSVAEERVSPDLLKQDVLLYNGVPVPVQAPQQRKFLGFQRDPLSVQNCGHRGFIQQQRFVCRGLRASVAGRSAGLRVHLVQLLHPFQVYLDLRQQHRQAVRLLDIVIPADTEGHQHIVVALARADEQDRQLHLFPELFADFKTGPVLQVDIQQDQVRAVLPQEGIARRFGCHILRAYVKHPEIFRCHPGKFFFVVHDQAVVMHLNPPPRCDIINVQRLPGFVKNAAQE